MGEPFKNLIGPAQVRTLSRALRAAWPGFPSARFEREARSGLETKELKARAAHVADALERALPANPARAMGVLVRSLGPKRPPVEDFGAGGLLLMPCSALLERLGPRDVEAGLKANYQLTQRFTAEFSIRPLIAAAPARTFQALTKWARDASPHVRRLVSEGTRTRLPWAAQLPALIADPSPVWPLLEALKDDRSETVRRSVANNLNDLSKDHPDAVLALCRRWLTSASTERRRLVERGLRTLVKKGHPRALALLGANTADQLKVVGRVAPARVRLGAQVEVSATLINPGDATVHAVVEACIHFVKARGAASARPFRLGRVDVKPGATKVVRRRFAVVHRSIRRLYAGSHTVEVQVNGRRVVAGRFTLSL